MQLTVLQPDVHEARWYETMADGRLHCYLCPRHCHIGEGQHGFCFIRKNDSGRLLQLGYGRPAALAMDPVEKKPLNHFFPGTKILSMGTAGCNMGCLFCQNWDISKAKSDQVNSLALSPEDVVAVALEHRAPHLAYTYNEPTIWGEYVIDIAREAHAAGLNNVMVSNGYITREAFFDIYRYIDAANIDLKAFTEGFYGKITMTHLQPVLDSPANGCGMRPASGSRSPTSSSPRSTTATPSSKSFATGYSTILATTFRCTSPPSIPTSSCATSRRLRRRRCTARGRSRARWA